MMMGENWVFVKLLLFIRDGGQFLSSDFFYTSYKLRNLDFYFIYIIELC